MATKELHNEIKNWKDLNNLIELYKTQSAHTFPLLYWALTILTTVILGVLITNSDKIMNYKPIGLYGWIFITLIFTLLLILLINLMGKAHKEVSDNLEYLYRKKDGQRV